MPWAILSVLVLMWGLPGINSILGQDHACVSSSLVYIILVMRMPPVVAEAHLESAIYKLSWLSASGSGILISAMISGLVMGYSFKELLKVYIETLKESAALPVDNLRDDGTRFCDPICGSGCHPGVDFRPNRRMLYPFFGTLLGLVRRSVDRFGYFLECAVSGLCRSSPLCNWVLARC